MGIDFTAVSISEPSKPFRDFCLANHTVLHAHQTFQEQNQGKACLLHPQSPGCPNPANADLGVFGTPCDPFSFQRCKRHQDGSVKGHLLYPVTFRDAIRFMSDPLAPKAVIMEQVEGFNEPDTPSSTEPTPMRRPGN